MVYNGFVDRKPQLENAAKFSKPLSAETAGQIGKLECKNGTVILIRVQSLVAIRRRQKSEFFVYLSRLNVNLNAGLKCAHSSAYHIIRRL